MSQNKYTVIFKLCVCVCTCHCAQLEVIGQCAESTLSFQVIEFKLLPRGQAPLPAEASPWSIKAFGMAL